MSLEYVIPHKHTLKILCKSIHFPRKCKRKREWFFSEHSVVCPVSCGSLTLTPLVPCTENALGIVHSKKEFEEYMYRNKLFGEVPCWGIYIERKDVFMVESVMKVETCSRGFMFQVDHPVLDVSLRSGRCHQRTNLLTNFSRTP